LPLSLPRSPVRFIAQGRRDDPGELTPEAALAYFAKHEGFIGGFEICDYDGPLTEFVLEKREVLRRQVGARQWLSAGKTIDTYSVRLHH
jgi:hypothetical protein